MLWKWLTTRNRSKTRTPVRARLSFETLEDRTVPATLLALTTTQQLLMFDENNATAVVQSPVITGLTNADEQLVSIDARPANGLIYGLSDANILYTIDLSTAVATRVGNTEPAFAQLGQRVGIDFNPAVDRLRIDTNANQNYRINPNTGALVTPQDTDLAFGEGRFEGVDPTIVEVAYDRNFQGTTQTTLFGIDANLNRLVRIGSANGTPNSPNGGVLEDVGPLRRDGGKRMGFDILADGRAFMAMRENDGFARLYTIDLTTGLASRVGLIGNGNFRIIGLTEVPRDEIVFATTTTNRLVSFAANDPNTLLSDTAITGLNGGEGIVGIDFRPLDGTLYALTSTNRVLTINTATAAATEVNAGIMYTPAFVAGSPNGFDFNPTVDRLRLVNADNDNARFNPTNNMPVDSDNNGANGNTPDNDLAYIATDANVGVDPTVVAVAYDRNDRTIGNVMLDTPTTLFGIDSSLNTLVRQGAVDGNTDDVAGGGSPNGGLLTTLGSLGVDPTDLVGFDIIDNGRNGQGAALAVMQLNGENVSKLFQINLSSGLTNQALGTATLVGTVGTTDLITAMAIAPPRIQFAASNFTVTENGVQGFVRITRTGGSGNPNTASTLATTVTFSTADGSATAGEDYVSVPIPGGGANVVPLARGVTSVLVSVLISINNGREPDETINLMLSNATGGNTLLGTQTTAVLTITETT